MPYFAKRSRDNLRTCHVDLIKLFTEVINYFDCTVICGHRGEHAQNKAFREGKSRLVFPLSKHNKSPSMAADVIPYPIDWDDEDRMRYFAGFVKGVANQMHKNGEISHKIRWGGDWDQDTKVLDNTFNDLVHFELV